MGDTKGIEEKESTDNSYLKTNAIQNYNTYVLTEKDFYPPEDDRIYQSGVYDINGGDNFRDYAVDFYEEYENEIFDV